MTNRLALGLAAAVIPSLICFYFGRWFGMNVLGLTDPTGAENVAAAIIGLFVLMVLAGACAGLYYLGEAVERYLSVKR